MWNGPGWYATLAGCMVWIVFLAAAADDAPPDAEPPSAVGSIMRLWRSGRVPAERLPALVELVGTRGNEHDLRFLYDQVLESQEWPEPLRQQALTQLLDAAETRKVRPTGELAGVIRFLDPAGDERTLQTAIALCGAWQVAESVEALQHLVWEETSPPRQRRLAVRALVQLDPETARPILLALCHNASSFEMRALGVSGLVSLDADAASREAAHLLASAGPEDDPRGLLDAFLQQQGGSDRLAQALEDVEVSEDLAKLALRHMYSVGRSDDSLTNILSSRAGFDSDPQPPTPEEVEALARELAELGDPLRGEQVFRRDDLSCLKCHAVSKAGGQVGPDLSAIGSSSPVDYIIHSVLNPDRDVKEAYLSLTVATVEGQILQGILVDRTAERLTLRDSHGELLTIPTIDIDDEVEGKSLMPKGLVRFMTHQELLDLLAFLVELGKPGDFAIRETQRMQRWRVLLQPDPELLERTPNSTTLASLVLGSTFWKPVYSLVNGRLPLDEICRDEGATVLYVYGEVDVSQAGDVEFALDSPDGLTAWVETDEVGSVARFIRRLEAGRHRIVLRIDLAERTDPTLILELRRPSGSTAEFVVVDGM